VIGAVAASAEVSLSVSDFSSIAVNQST